MMMRPGSLFTSLQCHINKIYDHAPFIRVDVTGPSRGESFELTQDQLEGRKCSECRSDATYFVNVCGRESMVCNIHAEDTRRRLVQHDELNWFIKPLFEAHSIDDMHYIMVCKPSDDRYAGLPWVWQAHPSKKFRIYRHETVNNDYQKIPGTKIESITKKQIRQLMFQLQLEQKKKRPVYVIGFTCDHPSNRPDFSHGYSVGIHICDDCTVEHFEPYCFKYPRTEDLPVIDDTTWKADYMEFDPETFSFSCSQ